MRCLVLLGAAAACASPDAPFFNRGGVSIENDSAVYMGPMRVDLGTSTLQLPTHISINDVDLLRPLDMCTESQLGVALYPVANAVGDTVRATPQPATIEARGPVAVRVRIPYQVPYSCGGTMSSLSGSTTLTFFSNGRIVRRDEDVIGSTAAQLPMDARMCMSCSNTDDPYNLTSFWAFASGEVYDDAFRKMSFVDSKRACILVGNVMVGIEYDNAHPYTTGNADGYPKTVARLLPQSPDTWPAGLPGQSSSSQVSFALGTDAAACAAAMAQLDVKTIFLDTDVLTFADGVYRSATPHREPFTITVPEKLEASFVLDVDLGGAKHARVMIGDRVFDAYSVQQLGDRVLFDLPPIDKGESYRIEPF